MNVVSANDRIGVAIFGAGNVSSGHLDAYQHSPRCEVVAIGSRTKSGAEAKAREVGIDPSTIGIYDSIENLLSDPNVDALSITTPHSRHASDVIASANAGKHCLVEKPIAVSLDELEAMDAAVTAAGIRTRLLGLCCGSIRPPLRPKRSSNRECSVMCSTCKLTIGTTLSRVAIRGPKIISRRWTPAP